MIPNNSTASATNPTDTGPDPLHLIVTLLKTMSQISHITATLKNDSNSLTDRYSCAEHVPPPPNVTTKQNTVGSTQTDTIIGLRHKQLKPPRANSTPTDPSHTQVSFLQYDQQTWSSTSNYNLSRYQVHPLCPSSSSLQDVPPPPSITLLLSSNICIQLSSNQSPPLKMRHISGVAALS